MVQFRDEHRRHAMQDHAALRLDRFEHRQRIESGGRIDHCHAVDDAHQVAHYHAEAMVERYRDTDPVARHGAHRSADHRRIVERVVMREGHSLGRARGAAGELNIDRVGRLQGGGDAGELRLRSLSAEVRHITEIQPAGPEIAADLDRGARPEGQPTRPRRAAGHVR